jgi:hypothetical protein
MAKFRSIGEAFFSSYSDMGYLGCEVKFYGVTLRPGMFPEYVVEQRTNLGRIYGYVNADESSVTLTYMSGAAEIPWYTARFKPVILTEAETKEIEKIVLRESALKKLTPEEQKALGL